MASMLDIAYNYIDKAEKEVNFNDLWNYVVVACELSEEAAVAKLPRFYSNLMIDGRFITLGQNIWDLRSRHTFQESHIDTGEVYREADENIERDEDEEDLLADDNEEANEENVSEEKEEKDEY